MAKPSADYRRFVIDSTWKTFNGPNGFDAEGYRRFQEERRSFFAAGRNKKEAPSLWRSWAHCLGLIAK
jgi:hypothetical protein